MRCSYFKSTLNKIFAALLLCLSTGALLTPPRAIAQADRRPARVGELEEKMTQDLSLYLRSRFPNKPFLVKVSVDPLREAPSNTKAEEGLPFLESDEVEKLEAWEDPKVSIHDLQQRVRRTIVSVSLPRSLNEAESNEIRDAIYSVLHLIPARDEVKIEQKDWKVEEPNWNLIYWIAGLVGAILVFALFGLYFIQWSQARKLGKILADSANRTAQAPAAPQAKQSERAPVRERAPPRREAPPPTQATRKNSKANEQKGQTIITDPFRLRQHFSELGATILEKGGIPSVEIMMILEDCGKKEGPTSLAAVLSAFPESLVLELFRWSKGSAWLEAQTVAPEYTTDGQEILETLFLNLSPSSRSPIIEKIRMAAARLDKELPRWIETLEQDTAFALLSELPKGIAIDAARAAFPGSWARLFESKTLAELLSQADAQQALLNNILSVKPLRDPEEIVRFKKFREMIDYLDHANIDVEEEVYRTLPRGSQLPQMRRPLYRLKELTDEEIKEFVSQQDIQELALAIVGWKEGESRIRPLLADKAQSLFSEWLERFGEELKDATREDLMGGSLLVQRQEIQRRLADQVHELLAQKERETHAAA